MKTTAGGTTPEIITVIAVTVRTKLIQNRAGRRKLCCSALRLQDNRA
jgi:hypothetical protein